jgi:hypothetical protein
MDIKLFKKTLKQKITNIKNNKTFDNTEFDDIIQYINESNPETPALKAIQINAVNVKGILYYIDAFQNVYKTEDILEKVDDPQIIGKAIIE